MPSLIFYWKQYASTSLFFLKEVIFLTKGEFQKKINFELLELLVRPHAG